MREIKFRQWLKGQWHYFEFNDGMCSGVVNASISEYPIMQYTGLKDRSGVEIYANDIFHIGSDDEKYQYIKWDNNDSLFRFYSCEDNEPLNEIWVYNLFTFEIIGNIHENPELLEER